MVLFNFVSYAVAIVTSFLIICITTNAAIDTSIDTAKFTVIICIHFV